MKSKKMLLILAAIIFVLSCSNENSVEKSNIKKNNQVMIHSTWMTQNILIPSLHPLDFNVYGYDITGISPVSIHFLLLFNVCLSLVSF